MITTPYNVIDAEVLNDVQMNPNSAYDLSGIVTAENAGVLLDTKGTDSTERPQPTTEQLIAYMQHMRRLHNAKCRKKGFKDHIHQASGHKLERKLARQNSLYGRVSLVSQMYNDIQIRNFKEAKEAAAAKLEMLKARVVNALPHATNTSNPVDFTKDANAAV